MTLFLALIPRKHALVCSALSHVVFGFLHGKGFFISQLNRAVLSRISSTTRFFFFCFESRCLSFIANISGNHADVGLIYSKQCYRLLATKLGCFELYLTQQNVFTLLLLSLLFPRTTLFWTWPSWVGTVDGDLGRLYTACGEFWWRTSSNS